MKEQFSRSLGARPGRLHMAAHSHHPWPDVSFEAQQRAWLDAARELDEKWDGAVAAEMDRARRRVAALIGAPGDGSTVVTATNTHELVLRILSCLATPVRVLTTDAEFHSFRRQLGRLQESGLAFVDRVRSEPWATFADRFATAATEGGHDLVFFSHVHFDSGYVVPNLEALVDAVPDEGSFVVVDGYHAFMALPVDVSTVARRAFYLAGGYKYAMAGEGACWMHCPDGYGPRPVDTGWYAGFGELAASSTGGVAYPAGADRFLGATFDPTPWYRFVAVQQWLDTIGWNSERIHAHAGGLQHRLLAGLDELGVEGLGRRWLVPPVETIVDRGNFLTFRSPRAEELRAGLRRREVITDLREDRLRIGFGLYHDDADVDDLLARLTTVV